MKKCYLAVFSLLFIVLMGHPGLAETPAESIVDDIRATNVQRLILTNECYRCDLAGMDLSQTHLIGADLREATLAGADLSWSNLEGADLTNVNLTGANFTGAFLTNASLAYTNLDNVNFTQAQLYYVDVTGASMEHLNLADATVIGTPISVGGSLEPLEEDLPAQPFPPIEPWIAPWQSPGEFLDIPPQILPQV
ncbi:MAG: pentapeptide repeat-containing protein [Cyanobacteria bacterium J06627_3]